MLENIENKHVHIQNHTIFSNILGVDLNNVQFHVYSIALSPSSLLLSQ